MKNDVEVDYGRNSVAPRPRFSLISLNFSQCWTLEPFTQPPSCLFIAKDGIRGHGSSPRQAGYFTPKMTLLPLSFGIFRILDQNIE